MGPFLLLLHIKCKLLQKINWVNKIIVAAISVIFLHFHYLLLHVENKGLLSQSEEYFPNISDWSSAVGIIFPKVGKINPINYTCFS